MARSCIFCGKPATSNEHIWGKSLIEEAIGKPGVLKVDSRGRGKIFGPWAERTIRAYRSDMPRQTVKVCPTCNSGWMSQLEAACKTILVRMAHGETVMLDGQTQDLISRYALKTGISVGAAIRTHAVPPSDIQLLVDHGKLSPRVSVHLFAYDGPRLVSYKMGPSSVRFGSPDAPAVPAFSITLLLSHLVLQILGHSGPQERPIQYSRESDDFRVQIFPPETIGAVMWPPKYALADDGFMRLVIDGPWFVPS